MTKTQDQLFFFYYNKNDGLRITDRQNRVICQNAGWDSTRVVKTLPSGTQFRYVERRLDPRSIPCD